MSFGFPNIPFRPGRPRASLPTLWTLVFAVVASVVACSQRVESGRGGEGYLQIIAQPTTGAPCERCVPTSGALDIRSLDESSATQVAASELAQNGPVWRTLAAGLYSVSWLPSPDDDEPSWQLREPKILNVFAGQVTKLQVQQEGIGGERASSDPVSPTSTMALSHRIGLPMHRSASCPMTAAASWCARGSTEPARKQALVR